MSLLRYAGAVCDLAQPEGITFFQLPGSANITMLAAGEPYEVFVFEADAACDLPYNSSTGDEYACPEKAVGEEGCERTASEGGCPLSRCSKDLGPNAKVCAKGINPCSLSGCEQKCAASYTSDGFSGGADSGGDAGSGGDAKFRGCTHYAYDEREETHGRH